MARPGTGPLSDATNKVCGTRVRYCKRCFLSAGHVVRMRSLTEIGVCVHFAHPIANGVNAFSLKGSPDSASTRGGNGRVRAGARFRHAEPEAVRAHALAAAFSGVGRSRPAHSARHPAPRACLPERARPTWPGMSASGCFTRSTW